MALSTRTTPQIRPSISPGARTVKGSSSPGSPPPPRRRSSTPARESGAATQLIAMGGSYGGFMTLAVLVEDPSLWAVGIDVVGIADWHSFLRNTSGWRRSLRVSEYGEPEGPDGTFLAEFSPLRRSDVITAHLLVIHGRNDVRVPVAE